MAEFPDVFSQKIAEIRRGEQVKADFSREKLTDADMLELADALKGNSSVTHIDVSQNSFSDEGVIALAEALEGNTSVTSLKVTITTFGDDGMEAVAAMLKNNSTIREVFVTGNQFGNKGAIALAGALESNDTINILGIANNNIDDIGALALSKVLGRKKNLVRLYSGNNPFSPLGQAALEKELMEGDTKNLIYINDSSNELSVFYSCNRGRAEQMLEKIENIETCTGRDFWDISVRMPAIRDIGQNKEAKIFENWLSLVPQANLETLQSFNDLLIPEGSQYTPFDHPSTWQNFGQIVSALAEKGCFLTAKDLITDGKPSDMLDMIMHTGNAEAVFSAKLWQTAPQGALKSVIKAMPDDMKSQIPNRHSLMASLERPDHIGQQR